MSRKQQTQKTEIEGTIYSINPDANAIELAILKAWDEKDFETVAKLSLEE
jgi:hypothetical protein